MRILVTGGCGFIGKHLVTKLRELRHDVVSIDIKGEPDYVIDICNIEELDLLHGKKFDTIYHLAAMSYGRGSEEQPQVDIQTNVQGTFNICTYAKNHNIKRIIYTSTMAVYGNRDNAKEDDVLNPLSNYACSKLYGEFCIKRFREYNIDSVIFRLFNTYGPGSDLSNSNKGIVNAFISQLNSDRINVTGSLERYRDLIYIDDVIQALVLPLTQNNMKGTFNVCSGQKTTIKNLIEEILKIANISEPAQIENIGGHAGDPHGVYGNNTQLCRWGWTPQTPLLTGLDNCWEALC